MGRYSYRIGDMGFSALLKHTSAGWMCASLDTCLLSYNQDPPPSFQIHNKRRHVNNHIYNPPHAHMTVRLHDPTIIHVSLTHILSWGVSH